MSKAYFVKVNESITWADVLRATKEQINSSRKQLEYISIADLVLLKEDFESLIASIAQPHLAYIHWVSQSIADANCVWNCITIKCASDKRSIIIYTSGRTVPLYVAINIENQ